MRMHRHSPFLPDQNLLKWIAVISMTIDHTGMVLFPQITTMRLIGRLAFPLYCYLLVKGFLHTRSRSRYLGRMAVFALLSELPFDLACYGNFSWEGQNVFLTLLLSLGMLSVLELILMDTDVKKVYRMLLMTAVVFGTGLLTYVCGADYVFSGPFLVAGLYLYETQDRWQIRLFGHPVVSFAVFFAAMYAAWRIKGYSQDISLSGVIMEAYCLPAAWLIQFCSGKRRQSGGKYFFYFFYPVHLLLLYLIGRIWV